MSEIDLPLRRREDTNLTLKDWLQLLAISGALTANYVAWSNRIAVIETKVDFLYEEMKGRS